MGMGHAPVVVDVIRPENMDKAGFQPYEDLKTCLNEENVTLENLADIEFDPAMADDITDNADRVIRAYERFKHEFEKKYSIGINANSHNAETDGDRYDDIDGPFFELNFADLYQISNKARHLKSDIPFETAGFVMFG